MHCRTKNCTEILVKPATHTGAMKCIQLTVHRIWVQTSGSEWDDESVEPAVAVASNDLRWFPVCQRAVPRTIIVTHMPCNNSNLLLTEEGGVHVVLFASMF